MHNHNRTDSNVANQEHDRQNCTVKNIAHLISNANDEISSESRRTNPTRFEKWPREGLLPFAQLQKFSLEQENKNTAQKTECDVRLLERFLNLYSKYYTKKTHYL